MSIARSENPALARRASTRKSLQSVARWKREARTFWCDESGQDLIEYALVAGLVGLGCIASVRGLTNGVAAVFNKLGSTLINST